MHTISANIPANKLNMSTANKLNISTISKTSKFTCKNVEVERLKGQVMMLEQKLSQNDEAVEQLEELKKKMKDSEEELYKLIEEKAVKDS